MRTCYSLKTKSVVIPPPSNQTIVVRRYAALGDCLASTIVADKLVERGYSVIWEAHPSAHCILRRQPSISSVREPNGDSCQCNLDRAYEDHPGRRWFTFSQLFIARANSQLAARGIYLGKALNCKPYIYVSPEEKAMSEKRFSKYPKPWIFISPRSNGWPNRTVNPGTWSEAAANMQGTKFWLGQLEAPANFVDLKCQHFDDVILWMSVADLLVSVDTGPLHVGAAMDIPILALGQSSDPELHLSDQTDFNTIYPFKLDCLNCQKTVCPIIGMEGAPPCQNFDPDFIALWANAKLRAKYSNRISAVIPIYQPEKSVLNRCIEHVLPQVDEIIVTSEIDSIIPPGAIQHPKIQYVKKNMAKIGYARNCNFGVRHTTGKFICILNDDVFLNPDAIQQMLKVMTDDVGCVAGKLWYPDGTLYHAGKFRNPGERAWNHIDLKGRVPTIKDSMEVENINGAAMLFRREAFYEIDGFDEDYFGYCSDDDTCMKLRQSGWKIIYQPHAEGVHMEGQSFIKLTGDRGSLVREAGEIFEKKWGWWLDKNINTVPGNF